MTLPLTPERCRAARALLGWSIVRLAGRAAVPEYTVRAFEAGTAMPREAYLAALLGTLEAEGVEFTDEGACGVRLRARGDAPSG